jgi:hypothetical protein
MKAKDFIVRVQEYYENYPKAQLREIAAYLSAKSDTYLDSLYRACLYGYSAKWKSPPDIAVFEELKKEALRLQEKATPDFSVPQIEEGIVSPEEGKKYIKKILNRLEGRKDEEKTKRYTDNHEF